MSNPDEQSQQPWLTCQPTGRLLRPSDVISRTGLSRSQIYQMISEERFPPFIKLSTRASAMPEAWLQAFIDLRAKESLQRRATNGASFGVEQTGV